MENNILITLYLVLFFCFEFHIIMNFGCDYGSKIDFGAFLFI
jgi:hypothetical protein